MVREAFAQQRPSFLTGNTAKEEAVPSSAEGVVPPTKQPTPPLNEQAAPNNLPPIESAPRRGKEATGIKSLDAFVAGIDTGVGNILNLPIKGVQALSNAVFDTDFDTSKGFFPGEEEVKIIYDIDEDDSFSQKALFTAGEFLGAEAVTAGTIGGVGAVASKVATTGSRLNKVGSFLTQVARGANVQRSIIDAGIAGTTSAALDEYTALPESLKAPILFATTLGAGAVLNKGLASNAASKIQTASKAKYATAVEKGLNRGSISLSRLNAATETSPSIVRSLEESIIPIKADQSAAGKSLANSFDSVLTSLGRGKTAKKLKDLKVSSESLIEAKRAINRAVYNPALPAGLKRIGQQAVDQLDKLVVQRSIPTGSRTTFKEAEALSKLAHDINGANGKVARTIFDAIKGDDNIAKSLAANYLLYKVGGTGGLYGKYAFRGAKGALNASVFANDFAKLYANNPELRKAMFNLYRNSLVGASKATIQRAINRADEAATNTPQGSPAFLTADPKFREVQNGAG